MKIDKRTSKLDVRSLPGMLSRGKNVYMGGNTASNPVGKNQYSAKAIADAARKRIRNGRTS